MAGLKRFKVLATYVGFNADGKIVAASHALENDDWPEHRHRSFVRKGAVSTKKISPDAFAELCRTAGWAELT